MAIKILFWNINQKGDAFIAKLKSVATNVAILILAESEISDAKIERELGLRLVPNKGNPDQNRFTPKLYSNIGKEFLEHHSTAPSKRLCFFMLKTQNHEEIIIAAIHFPGKVNYNGDTQSGQARLYAKWIAEIETVRQHKRTIVIGDFNMNPFEAGMIQPDGFNATLSESIAREQMRTMHYSKFDYFYNPMWNWLGDREHHSGNLKIPGSIYHKTTVDATQIFWNVFDKVIVRPELIDAIDYSSLKIIEAIPLNELLYDETYPDHLPLTFDLKISCI